MKVALAAVGALLLAANALTTRRLWASAAFERPQKVAQTALIWLLPGAFVVVRHFLGEPAREANDDLTVSKDGSFEAGDVIASHPGSGGHDGQ